MIKKTAIGLIIFIFSFILPLCVFAQEIETQNVLDVNMVFEDGKVSITSVKKRLGFAPDYFNQPNSAYKLQVISQGESAGYEVKFLFSTTYVAEEFLNNTTPSAQINTISSPAKTITIPYFENAKEIKILNPRDEVVATQNLESITSAEIEKPQKNTARVILYIFGGIVAVAAITAGAYFIKRKLFATESGYGF